MNFLAMPYFSIKRFFRIRAEDSAASATLDFPWPQLPSPFFGDLGDLTSAGQVALPKPGNPPVEENRPCLQVHLKNETGFSCPAQETTKFRLPVLQPFSVHAGRQSIECSIRYMGSGISQGSKPQPAQTHRLNSDRMNAAAGQGAILPPLLPAGRENRFCGKTAFLRR